MDTVLTNLSARIDFAKTAIDIHAMHCKTAFCETEQRRDELMDDIYRQMIVLSYAEAQSPVAMGEPLGIMADPTLQAMYDQRLSDTFYICDGPLNDFDD